jgi:hypothetical protein
MFNFFKPMDKELDKQYLEFINELRSYIPKVEDNKDSVTVTLKGPNVVTTITTHKDSMAGVLKDLGINVPKGSPIDTTEKRVTKQRK